MVSEPDIDLPSSDELRAGQREVYGEGGRGGAEQGQRAQAEWPGEAPRRRRPGSPGRSALEAPGGGKVLTSQVCMVAKPLLPV